MSDSSREAGVDQISNETHYGQVDADCERSGQDDRDRDCRRASQTSSGVTKILIV